MNLGEMLYRVASILQRDLRHGTCNAGSTTTVVYDSLLDEPAEFFNGGTFFGLSGALAGITRVVGDWSASSHTLSLNYNLPINPAGYPYAVMSAVYPRPVLVAAINQALKTVGPFTSKDETLVIAAQTERYALPAGVGRVVQVQLEVDPGIYSKPYQHWSEEGGYLSMDQNDYSLLDNLVGLHIRLWYEGEHAHLYNDGDVINADVAPELLATQAAWHAAMNRTAGSPVTDQDAQMDAALALALKTAQQRYPVTRRHKSSRLRS